MSHDQGDVTSPPRHRLIELPAIRDQRGALTFIEEGLHIPFAIERVFYIYDVPAGQSRAAHALDGVDEVIVALSGSFEAVLVDGEERSCVSLDRPDRGLYLPGSVWRELRSFAPGTVCLALASTRYDAKSYYDHDGSLEADPLPSAQT